MSTSVRDAIIGATCYHAIADFQTARAVIDAVCSISDDEAKQGDMVNLLLEVNKLAQRQEFISLLALCYSCGSKNGRGFPYVNDLEWALATLVELGQLEKVDDKRYRAVAGAPVLAIA